MYWPFLLWPGTSGRMPQANTLAVIDPELILSSCRATNAVPGDSSRLIFPWLKSCYTNLLGVGFFHTVLHSACYAFLVREISARPALGYRRRRLARLVLLLVAANQQGDGNRNIEDASDALQGRQHAYLAVKRNDIAVTYGREGY